MTIDNWTVYTAKDLRAGLGRINALISGLMREAKDPERKKHNFNNLITEIIAENDKDKIFYVYQLITRIAWLGRAIDRFDKDWGDEDTAT